MMIEDMSHPCCGVRVVTISMDEGDSAMISMLVVCGKPLGSDQLWWIDAIKVLRGIIVGSMGS